MTNEEKILQMLEKMDGRLGNLEKGQEAMRGDLAELKDEAAITRHSVNLLLKWAEKTDRTVNVGLYED